MKDELSTARDFYRSLGANVIPVKGKFPNPFIQEPDGIAICCGRYFRCFDIDGCRDMSVIRRMLAFMELPESYPWLVESPKGYHIWIYCNERLTALPYHNVHYPQLWWGLPDLEGSFPFLRLELRWARTYVVAPNSPGYRFLNGQPTAAPDMVPALLVEQCFLGMVEEWVQDLPLDDYDLYLYISQDHEDHEDHEIDEYDE
jgi:hypothetical protein